MRVIYGSYTGDGVGDRAIDLSPLGGDLKFLVVQRSGQALVWRYDVSGGLSFSNNSVGTAGLLKSITGTGFTVGTAAQVNAAGATYHYWGLVDTGDGDIVTGSYTGNATDNRNITASLGGGTPAFVFVKGDTAQYASWRTADVPGDLGLTWPFTTAANTVQALSADAFQVGTNAQVNGSGVTYYYCAALAVAGVLATLTYTGDGVDNRSITGAGFAPHLALTTQSAVSATRYLTATMSAAAGGWYPFTGGANADSIQALEADGFQVGSDGEANASGGTYYTLCLRSLPPSTTVDMDALESGAVFGEPSVTLGGIAVDLEAKESGLAVGEPTVTLGGISVEVEAQESSLTFGEPEVALGTLTVDVDAVPSALSFGEPAVSVGPAWRPVRPGGRLVPLATRAGRIEAAAERSGRVVISQEA